MLTTALVPTAERWKQPDCPSSNKQINKLWPLAPMEHYSAIERNEATT